MEIKVFDSVQKVGQAAAMIFAAQLMKNPRSVLGLATGSTPIPTYQQLIALYQEGLVDFSQAQSYNLDEYCGLSHEHVCSYYYFMHEQLFDHINIAKDAVHVPSGMAQDFDAECKGYDAAIAKAGGVDLQLLGIGRNGHIAFNEPDACFTHGTHVVSLTKSTIQANRRFFDSEDQVPTRAITMGVGSIMAARQILLLATGEDKAEAIRDTVKGDITPQVQASILRTHPNVVVLLDREAASLL